MKKVLIYGLTGNLGGIESFIYNHVSSMDLSGLEIHFLVYETPVFYEELKKMGGKFHFIPRRGQDFLNNRKMTKNLFKEIKFDRIWFNVCTMTYILPIKCAFENGVPIRVVHVHSPKASGGWKMELFHKLNKNKIEKYGNIFLSCSVGASEFSYNENILETEKYKIIYNAIDIDKFVFDRGKRKEIREELGLKDDFVIGNVGRLSDVKNHDFLIDIFSEILKEKPLSKLIIVGEGDKRLELEEKIKRLNLEDKIFLLGVRDNIHELLCAFDAYVFPSKYEGLSLSLVEAQVSGLRCFTSSNVSEENDLTGNVFFSDLNESPKYWADKILLNASTYERKNYSDLLKSLGFDVVENGKVIKEILIGDYKFEGSI